MNRSLLIAVTVLLQSSKGFVTRGVRSEAHSGERTWSEELPSDSK